LNGYPGDNPIENREDRTGGKDNASGIAPSPSRVEAAVALEQLAD
jgi:hypothetical protein